MSVEPKTLAFSYVWKIVEWGEPAWVMRSDSVFLSQAQGI